MPAQIQTSSQRASTQPMSASVLKSAVTSSSGQEELLKLIDQAEISVQEQFHQLRTCILHMHSLESDCTKPGDLDRKSVERILQAERENIARQRAIEQEQVRSTMQQLTEAWLQLEREQLMHGGQHGSQQTCPAYYDETLLGSVHVQNESGAASQLPAKASCSGQSLTALGFQPSASAPVDIGAKGSEELFHKLRSDLKKRAASRS